MDWQQPAALAIVALTVVLGLRARFRARAKGGSGCGGCPAAGPALETRPSLRVRTRRGERPEWVVRG